MRPHGNNWCSKDQTTTAHELMQIQAVYSLIGSSGEILNSKFDFQICLVTARDFSVTAVTGNPEPPREKKIDSGTKTLLRGQSSVRPADSFSA
jgi:hypothetical protein